MTAAPQPVLLYDGECGLCNFVVRLLLRTDRRQRLKFAPLQSAPAQAYLQSRGLPTRDFDTLVFVPDWNAPQLHVPLFRTDGAFAAGDTVGGIWRTVIWLRILPAGLRDPFYKVVARLRYALFGEFRGKPLSESKWSGRIIAA